MILSNGNHYPNDGLQLLIDSPNNENAFIEFAISKILFFDPNIVQQQWSNFLRSAEENGELVFCRDILHDTETRLRSHQLCKQRFANGRPLLYTSVISNNRSVSVNIATDVDGNCYPRFKSIYAYTGILISDDNASNIDNYTISNIWSGYGSNPYAFSCLWNLSLTPTFLTFLINGNSLPGTLKHKFIRLIQAVSYTLYKDIDGWIERSSGLVKPSELEAVKHEVERLIYIGKINLIGEQNNISDQLRIKILSNISRKPSNRYIVKFNDRYISGGRNLSMFRAVETVIVHYVENNQGCTISQLEKLKR